MRVTPAAHVIGETSFVGGAAGPAVLDVTGDVTVPVLLLDSGIEPFDLLAAGRGPLDEQGETGEDAGETGQQGGITPGDGTKALEGDSEDDAGNTLQYDAKIRQQMVRAGGLRTR